jgi:hypothetical protein
VLLLEVAPSLTFQSVRPLHRGRPAMRLGSIPAFSWFMHNITCSTGSLLPCMSVGKGDLTGHVIFCLNDIYVIYNDDNDHLKNFFYVICSRRDDTLQQSLPGLPILAVAAHQPLRR